MLQLVLCFPVLHGTEQFVLQTVIQGRSVFFMYQCTRTPHVTICNTRPFCILVPMYKNPPCYNTDFQTDATVAASQDYDCDLYVSGVFALLWPHVRSCSFIFSLLSLARSIERLPDAPSAMLTRL